MKFIFFLFFTAFLILIDLVSKQYFEMLLYQNSIVIFKDFSFVLAYNKGIAFSLPVTGLLQVVLTIVLLIILFYYVQKKWSWKAWLPVIGISFIFGGALGNLYGRIQEKGVIDFIQVFEWFPIFNFADIFIFIGVFFLVLCEWKSNK